MKGPDEFVLSPTFDGKLVNEYARGIRPRNTRRMENIIRVYHVADRSLNELSLYFRRYVLEEFSIGEGSYLCMLTRKQ